MSTTYKIIVGFNLLFLATALTAFQYFTELTHNQESIMETLSYNKTMYSLESSKLNRLELIQQVKEDSLDKVNNDNHNGYLADDTVIEEQKTFDLSNEYMNYLINQENCSRIQDIDGKMFERITHCQQPTEPRATYAEVVL